MKNFSFSITIVLLFVSCKQDTLIKHLETGLVSYDRARPVNEKLMDGITLEKFAIIKTNEESYSLVFMINNNVVKEEVEKYNVALEAILNEDNILLRDYKAAHNKKGFNFKPNLKIVGNYGYLISEIQTKIKRFESLDIWLFLLDNEVYKSAGGNRIQIKNLGL
tara:strand:+ start:163 stop:654 length:492 start_codon:yes stop_codon:yes gene_type:complete